MGERRREGGIYGEQAPRLFVKQWIEAASDAEVVLTDGQIASGEWVLVATVNRSRSSTLLTPAQARTTADAFAHHMENPGLDALRGPMADIVMALRAGADEMERLHPAPPAAGFGNAMLPGLSS